jgi:hypothetical protein
MRGKIGVRWCVALAFAFPPIGAGCGGQVADGPGVTGTGGSGGAGMSGTCTSQLTWLGGNEGSADMNPGMACVSCHASTGGEAPIFTIAGTVYPSFHEPDGCYGAAGTSGVQVVITGADGKTLTLTPSGAGNFYSTAAVALPFQAKVLYMGRVGTMLEAQSTGDCNSCHTQNGTNLAPGRIVLP